MSDEGGQPRVSVVIPTYNRRGYVQEAIDSVLAQTYEDFEVIVVDDGSTDDTREVVERIRDPRVHYMYQSNAGRSAARNNGIAHSAGEYVAFLDDDDLYLPDKLASQVAFLEQHPEVELVAGGGDLVDKECRVIGAWRLWEEQPELRLEACMYGWTLLVCGVLLRRSALGRLDSWFADDLEVAEDTDFFLRLLLAGCTMAWDRRVVARYRLHRGGSQLDKARYSRAHQKRLERFFNRPDLPQSVRAQRSHITALWSLASACRCYATGQLDTAQQDLVRALALEPDLASGEFPTMFSQTIVGTAASWWVDDPLVYVDRVFANLPSSHEELNRLRGETLSAMHMKRVFRANATGEPLRWQDWWGGVRHDPRWLRNRGVWAILVHAFVGGRLVWRNRLSGNAT